MNEPFVKVDLHGLRQDEAIRVINRALASAGPATYHLQLIHGYHRGTSLRSMIQDEYRWHPKVLRIMPHSVDANAIGRFSSRQKDSSASSGPIRCR